MGIVVIVVLLVVLVPVVLAGGFTVPVAKATFTETTGTLVASNMTITTSVVTALEYYFSIRTGGMVRTTDTSTGSASSSDSTNITISMTLRNPMNQTIDLGNTQISGGIGTRSHTVYLSIDQGVRVSGSYELDVTITAHVVVGGLVEVGISPQVLKANFTIS